MKFCYQVATPDVAVSPDVTSFQGKLEDSLDFLAGLGYDGVEFMTRAPLELDQEKVKRELDRRGLMVSLVCTGEVYGQLKWNYTDPDADIRRNAIRRTKEIIDFAALLGADINVGRIRGQYRHGVDPEATRGWFVDSMRELSDHAAPRGVRIAIEHVNILQGNFLNTTAEAVAMAGTIGRDNCQIMLDVFHMNIEERDMLGAIAQAVPWTIHVHLADNNRRHPGQCGFDFEKIVQAFYDVGYDGNFTTEIFQLPDQETSARESIRHLAPIFGRIYGHRA